MSFLSNTAVGLGICAMMTGVITTMHPGSRGKTLRVCADPENLPFSDSQQTGFENRIAALVASDMHSTVAYTWWPEQRSFLRSTLRAGKCDVVLGAAPGEARVITTDPYYRSTYVFVTRRDIPPITSMDDPRLQRMTIGVPVIGIEYNSLPPVVALARRHFVSRVKGYMLFESPGDQNPWRKVIGAVANGDVDVGIAWGPAAGYFSQHAAVPLTVTPIPETDIPMSFGVAMGVRPADTLLRDTLQRILTHERGRIRAILQHYRVPVVDSRGGSPTRPSSPVNDTTPAQGADTVKGVQPGIHPQVIYGTLVNPYAGDAKVAAAGRKLFVWYNCSGCHGGRAGGGMGPNLRDSTQRKYGNSDTQLYATIVEGRPAGMPTWGGKLTKDQIWQLITYIRTLDTPAEPDRVSVPSPKS